MKIYLIRHGETVDNIAGVYAGVKDSQLTNYGVEQTSRLGEHFATTGVVFTHIFASPLTRAYQTAEAVRKGQEKSGKDTTHVPEIVKVGDLIEQDFGFYEGKTFQARSSPKKTGRETHADQHRNQPGFQDVETKEAMATRADTFLNEHLMPLVAADDAVELVIAIVSHGMLLSTLWRRMLRRMATGTVTINPEVVAARGPIVLEHLGGWSNTGYLELDLQRLQSEPAKLKGDEEVSKATLATAKPAQQTPASSRGFLDYSVKIVAIDSKAHLIGLKRQRGGIGRLAHDTSQRKLTGFFKKPKIG